MIYKLNALNKYERAKIYSKGDEAKVEIFDDLVIRFNEVYKED